MGPPPPADLEAAQLEQSQIEASWSTPEAVAERVDSRTAFSGLGTDGAVALATQTFSAVAEPKWRPPRLEPGD
jgi:hypothetical protein